MGVVRWQVSGFDKPLKLRDAGGNGFVFRDPAQFSAALDSHLSVLLSVSVSVSFSVVRSFQRRVTGSDPVWGFPGLASLAVPFPLLRLRIAQRDIGSRAKAN